MKSMLEVAAEAATVLGSAGAAAMFGGGIVRASGRLFCFICNLGHGSGLPGTLPGLGGPLGGSDDPGDDKKDDDNKCAGEERAVLEWNGRVATWEEQVKYTQGEIQKLGGPMNRLLGELGKLASDAQSELLQYLADDALDKLRDFALGKFNIPGTEDFDFGDVFGAAQGSDSSGLLVKFGTENDALDAGAGDVKGFFNDLVRYIRLLRDLKSGSFDEVKKIADEKRASGEPMSAIDQYFQKTAELKALVDQGFALTNLLTQKQEELRQYREKLAEAQKALDECRAKVG
jgi:hypothetical protein